MVDDLSPNRSSVTKQISTLTNLTIKKERERERFNVDVACMDEKQKHTKYTSVNLKEREDFVKPTSRWKHNLISHSSVWSEIIWFGTLSTGYNCVNTARSITNNR